MGQLIPRVRWSLDRAGYVVVTAETAQAARDLAQSLASQVRFVTEPDPAAVPSDPGASAPEGAASEPEDDPMKALEDAVKKDAEKK